MSSRPRRLGWLASGLIGLVATSSGWAGGQQKTPSDVDPGIKYYIERLDRDDPEVSLMLGRLGDRALPPLMDLLRDKQAGAPRRRGALKAVGYMGPDAKEAAPVVIGILASRDGADRGSRAASAETLGKMGSDDPRIVDALREALKDSELVVRQAAVDALFSLGGGAAAAVQELTDLLSSPDEKLRQAAADCLGRIGTPANRAAPRLIAILAADPSPRVRRSTAVALRFVGPDPVKALGPLIEVVRGRSDAELQRAAVDTLAVLGPAAIGAIPALEDRLERADDPRVRRSACIALGNIGPAAKGATKKLIDGLESRDRDLAREAAVAIGRIRPDEEAIRPLIAALGRDDPEIKQAAADVLNKVGPQARIAADHLRELLSDPDARVRRSAADALGEIDPRSPSRSRVVDELGRLYLRDRDEEIRRSVAVALGKLRGADSDMMPLLRSDLNHPSPALREAAIFALWENWPQPSLMPDFIPLLDDSEWGVRRAAIDGLAHIGHPDGTVIKKLKALLRDNAAWEVRRSAAAALRMVKAEDASADLVEALGDRHWEVRRSAAFALLAIGPGPEAAPQLVAALADRDWLVHRACADTLARIEPPPERDLIDGLDPQKWSSVGVRLGVADALRQLGAKGYRALPVLAVRIRDETESQARRKAVDAVRAICAQLPADADGLATEELTQRSRAAEDSVRVLNQAASDRRDATEALTSLRDAISDLNARIRWKNLGGLYQSVKDHPWLTILGLYVASCLLLWGILYLAWPLKILRASELLKQNLALGPKFPNVEITDVLVRWATFLRLFEYRPPVLNAWVREYEERVIAAFEGVVQSRGYGIHIPVPIALDDRLFVRTDDPRLLDVFRGNVCLLIFGDGGSGKTNLACYLARRLSGGAGARRPAPPTMLPVLIDSEILGDAEEGPARADGTKAAPSRKALVRKIAGLLKQMTQEDYPPSDELVERLLSGRRILVLVDHFSEMTESTRQRIRPAAEEGPVNALIVTSRLEEEVGLRRMVRTSALDREQIGAFLEAYLQERQKDQTFTEGEIRAACEEIWRQEGGRPVKVGVVKNHAERILGSKDGEKAGVSPAA